MIFRTTLLLGALCLPCYAFTPSLQQGVAPTSKATPQQENLSRSCRRIVHMSNGSSWTGVARQLDGTWQIKQKNGWLKLPSDQVLRAPKEVEVMREFAARRLTLKGGARTQLELARWCIAEGLRSKGLQQLDSILDFHPHHPATLEFISQCKFIGSPSMEVTPADRADALRGLMKFAGSSTRSSKERAIHELANLEDQGVLHGELTSGLLNSNAPQRAFCAQALGRLFPGQDSKQLLRHAILDKSEGVRRSAAEALGAAHQPDLIVPVVRALKSAHPAVRLRASTALGYMAYPEAVEPLILYMAVAATSGSEVPIAKGYIFTGSQRAFIQDFDVEVASGQAVADPLINTLVQGSVLEAGVAGSSEYAFATTSQYARRSLSRLTGDTSSKSGRAWSNWWKKNGTEWRKRTTISHGVPGE